MYPERTGGPRILSGIPPRDVSMKHRRSAASRTTSTTTVPRQASANAVRSDTVVVVPAYNEHATVIAVLQQLEAFGFHSIIAVDDGSTDGTAALLEAWASTRPAAEVIYLLENRGKSAALREAWKRLAADVDAGAVSRETVIVTVDADGQHDLAHLAPLMARMESL